MKRNMFVMGLVACLPALALAAPGDILFSSNMDSAAGWTELADTDTVAQWGYDYTADATLGLTASPSGSTTGLHMQANSTDTTAAAAVFAAAANVNVAVPHQIEFNFYINMNGPMPGGGGGSTEFIGGGVGHDGATIGRNGSLLIADGDGGSSRDYRLYKNTGEQFVASGQYAVDTNNNSGVDLSAFFAGQPAPAAQVANYGQQTGTAANGTLAFGWHSMLIEADPNLGLASFTIDGLLIGTIDANIGTASAIAGQPAIYYGDIFSSISDNAALSFGIIDDYVVTEIVPEPASFALLAIGGVALLRRRR